MPMKKTQKIETYHSILTDLRNLFTRTKDPIARMATAASLLHGRFPDFIWTGYYRLVDGELTVGPYQGSLACMVLERHKGVCWAGFDKDGPLVVPDVHEFPGHIVCDNRASSELVIPLRDADGELVGVLDVDSNELDLFDDVDVENLERVNALIYH